MLLCHHDFGDRIHDLVMAAAATGGAMGDLLHLFERLFDIRELVALLQRLLHVVQGNLLAVAVMMCDNIDELRLCETIQ